VPGDTGQAGKPITARPIDQNPFASSKQEIDMRNLITSFARSEDGGISVEWVVVSAGVVGLCLATIALVSNGMEDISTDMQTTLAEKDPATPAFVAEPAEVDTDTSENTEQI
jgi:hypothetical protein